MPLPVPLAPFDIHDFKINIYDKFIIFKLFSELLDKLSMCPLSSCWLTRLPPQRQFQTATRQQVAIPQERCGRSVRHDPSIPQNQSPRADVQSKIQVMRGNDFRMGNAAQQIDQLPPAPRIESSRRFVHQQDIGSHG